MTSQTAARQRMVAIDCGSTNTKAVLIEAASTQHRVIATATVLSTHRRPWRDMTVGIRNALQVLEAKSGRTLLSSTQTPQKRAKNGSGADRIIIVVSAAEPLQVITAGLTRGASLKMARSGILTNYARLIDEISVSRRQDNQMLANSIKTLQNNNADLILMVGGVDGGASAPVINLAHILLMGLKIIPANQRPKLVFAGNIRLRAKLAEMFGNLVDFKPIQNLTPTLQHTTLGGLQQELEVLHREERTRRLPEFRTLTNWADNPLLTTGKSFIQTIHYLGQSYNINILGVDLGSRHTVFAARQQGQPHSAIFTSLGSGASAANLLQMSNPDQISQWLPFEANDTLVSDYLYNQQAAPQRHPIDEQSALLAPATATTIVAAGLAQSQEMWGYDLDTQMGLKWDLIVAGGQTFTAAKPHLAVYSLLNGLQPVGVSNLALDRYNTLGLLGALATVEPLAAAQIANHKNLHPLGVVIGVLGKGRRSDVALKMKITYADGREENHHFNGGEVVVLPLPRNEIARLDLRPARNYTLNPNGTDGGKRLKLAVTGGEIGIIIDTRGRPIYWAKQADERRIQCQNWLDTLAGRQASDDQAAIEESADVIANDPELEADNVT